MEENDNKLDIKKCILCNTQLSGRQTKYCSTKCRDKYRYEKSKTIPKVCMNCELEYLAASQSQMFCSISCKATFENKGKTGPDSRRWKGGRKRRSDGYVRVYAPDNPMAHKDGYVYEHRLLEGRKHGFCGFSSNIVVHHINGIKDDNRPENLKMVRSHSAHLKQHHNER